jgi:hypothetical protein
VLRPVGRSDASVLEDNRHTSRGSAVTAWVGSCLQGTLVLRNILELDTYGRSTEPADGG